MSLSASAVQGEQLYDPYGYHRYAEGTLGTDKGYTGQFIDEATGLAYDHARYYLRHIGVFLSPDSVQGNAQGMDPYAYVGGNPETKTDPTGEIPCPAQGSCGGDSGGGGAPPPPPPPPPTNPCELSGGNPEYCGGNGNPPPTPPSSPTTSQSGCGKLSIAQCNKGKQSQQQDIQNLKNEQQWLKVAIGGLTFVADLVTLIKDLLKASGVLKVLEVIGDFLSLIGDGLTILSQISTIFHWTEAQTVIDWLSTAANAIGAIYKGIRAALATPWGAIAAGLLVVGFYTLRTTLFGGGLSVLTAPILGALADHVLAGKDNPWKYGALAASSALQSWWSYDQYQIDLLSSESTATYCQSNPANC
jgi:RHS repeat-associated protein